PSPEPPGPPPAAWGPARTLAALAAFLVLVAIEAAIVAGFDPDIETLGARLGLQTALAATLIAVAFVAANPGPGLAAPPALGLRRPLVPAIKLSALAYLAYIGSALVIAALLQPEQEDVTRDLGFGEGNFGSVAAGLLIIGIAPVSEEIFFRGFLFGGLRRGTPLAVAAVLSAGIWGLFHYTGPGSWGVVLQLTVFGLALAWLYERTGSLWPPIALHVLNNALAFAVLTS
ncbi:MAG: lysostaphin resistance A-like protein, partial [Solirubrobacterales bacterium]